MIPRVGEPVRADQSYRHRPGAYAILVRGDRVLLTHQSRPQPEYQLPGGGVDPGEHILPALHREILEETGWKAGFLKRLGAFRRFTFMPEYNLWAEKLCNVYVGQPTVRHGDPSEPDHHAVWMPPAFAIDAVANEGDRLFLKKLFG
ncbi:MAG: NUDIX hydrolase [Pseudomonadota bacterium]